MILLREEGEQKVSECTFEVNEVYAVDVAMTTGEGKPREMDTRTTVFKRNVDKTYNLKMKGARTLYSEIKNKYPTLPFTIRSIEDERNAKLGVKECVQHELLAAYPVLYERSNDIIVHVKFTLLLLANGNVKITGLDLGQLGHDYVSDRSLTEELSTVLQTDMNVKKKKRANKKKGTASQGDGENGVDEKAIRTLVVWGRCKDSAMISFYCIEIYIYIYNVR